MKKLLAVALALFAVWACEKAQENDGDGKTVIPVPEAISVSPTSISSSVEGGDFIITVSAPTRPKLSGLPDWIGFDDGIFRDYSIEFTLNVSRKELPMLQLLPKAFLPLL